MATFSKKNKHKQVLPLAERQVYTQPDSAEESFLLLKDLEKDNWTTDDHIRLLNIQAFIENQHYRLKDAEKAYNEALDLTATCSNPVVWQTRLLVGLSGVLLNQRAWLMAEDALLLAANNMEQLGEQYAYLEARIFCRKGYVSLTLGHLDDAASHFLTTEKIYAEQGDVELEDAYFLALASTGLGDVYARLNDTKKSAQAIQKSLDLYGNYGFRINLIWHYLNTGRTYQTIKETEKAKLFYEKAIQLEAAGRAMERAQGSACTNLASILISEKALDKALVFLSQAETLYGEPEHGEDFLNLSLLEITRSRVSQVQEKDDSEIRHLKLAELHAQKADNKSHLQRISHTMADYFAKRSDFKRAYEFRTKAAEYSWEAAAQMQAERIQELQIKHDAERREKDARIARMQLTGLHLRALRLQMNPHFIFNAMNAIQGFVNTGRGEEAAIWLARFSKIMRKALDLSDLEEVDLSDEVDFLDQYLNLNKSLRFGDAFTYEIRVDKKLKGLFASIPAMIIQPFIENAIEHGLRPQKGGHLDVHFAFQDADSLICTVTDNGVGRYAKKELFGEKHKSKGVDITTERLKLLFGGQGKEGPFVRILDRGELTNGVEQGVISEVVLPIL